MKRNVATTSPSCPRRGGATLRVGGGHPSKYGFEFIRQTWIALRLRGDDVKCGPTSRNIGSAVSLGRNQSQHFAVFFVGQEPERAVGALAHVPDALSEVGQELLVRDDLPTLENEPLEVRAGEPADKQLALPLGDEIGGIEGEARDRDRRVPIVDRLLQALL